RPGAVGLLPSRRSGDDAVLKRGAVAVADGVEGAENVGRELAGLLEHRRDQVLGEITVEAFRERGAETGGVLEREGDVGGGGPGGAGGGGVGGQRGSCPPLSLNTGIRQEGRGKQCATCVCADCTRPLCANPAL